MKKNLLFIVSIFLGIASFIDNNAISKKELLSLVGRGSQTAMGLIVLGATAKGFMVLKGLAKESIKEGLSSTNQATGAILAFVGSMPLIFSIPSFALLGIFGAYETYKGVKGIQKTIKKIKKHNTKKD